LTAAFSFLAHLGVLAALLFVQPTPVMDVELQPIAVELVPPRRLADPVKRLEPPQPAPAEPPPPRNIARPVKTPPPPQVETIAAGDGPAAEGTNELSDAQVASATTAGSGPSGRACDMVQRLQTALRKDRQVQAAMAAAHRGKALMVWDGDWVRHPGQEGNGLAAVREAIMWEVGFAPEACRSEPVHGLVLLSLNDGQGASRVVVGAGGAWRWSDLLGLRGGGTTRR
jgi:hypothetical protein